MKTAGNSINPNELKLLIALMLAAAVYLYLQTKKII